MEEYEKIKQQPKEEAKDAKLPVSVGLDYVGFCPVTVDLEQSHVCLLYTSAHRLEFNMVQCQKPTLPEVDKSAISNLSFKAFNKPDKNIPKLDYPTISINKIKPYKNITVKANGLPDINNIAILDKSNIQSIKDIFLSLIHI